MRGPHGEKAWCSESGVRRGLLHDVGKLVREQPPPSAGRRKITASVKNHILGHCVGKRVHGSRRPRRLCVGVHPHLIKVMTKVQLKKFAVFGSRGWPAERSTSWTIGRASPPPSVSPPRRESDARRSIVFSFWQSSHSPPAPPAPPQSHLRRNRGSTLIRENDHCRRIPPPFMTASATRSASCSNTSSGAPMRRALPLLLTGTATLAAPDAPGSIAIGPSRSAGVRLDRAQASLAPCSANTRDSSACRPSTTAFCWVGSKPLSVS